MKFEIHPKDLRKMTARIARVAKRAPDFRRMVRIDADNEGVRLVFAYKAQSENIEYRTERFPARVETTGEACIFHPFLVELKPPSTKEPVVFELVNPELVEDGDRLLVVEQGKYHRESAIHDAFPAFDALLADGLGWNDLRIMSLSVGEFRRGVVSSMHAMASKDVRLFLNGVWISREKGNLIFVGTDGHRMSACETKSSGDDFAEVLLFEPTVRELAAVLKDFDDAGSVVVRADESRFGIDIGDEAGGRIVSLVDNHPNSKRPLWRKILDPDLNKAKVQVSADIDETVEAIKCVIQKKEDPVQLVVKPDSISVSKFEGKTGAVDVPAQGTIAGEDTIKFNSKYLMEALSDVESRRFKLNGFDKDNAFIFEFADEPGVRRAVMGMRD